ncbi:MAG: PEP-utilizing enzyme [Methanosarcinales archaeon]
MRDKQNKKVILKGIAASPGMVKGFVRIAFDPTDALKKFQKDDILVTPMTDPSWTICIGKAKAIITNSGGILSHAAIVAREMGIPAVVGTKDATEKLKHGMEVIVDGSKGVVYI